MNPKFPDPREPMHKTIGRAILMLAVEAKAVSLEDAVAYSGESAEVLAAFRARVIKMTVQEVALRKAKRAAKRARPVCKLVNLEGCVGWLNEPDMPVLKVRVVRVNAAPCAGCGGRGGEIEIIPGGEKTGIVGAKVGPVCLDMVVFEDDPEAAMRLVDVKARLNSSVN